MLGKDAPRALFVRELARFTVITILLPARRIRRIAIPSGQQFRVTLRFRVIGGVISRLPAILRARREVTRMARRAGTSRAKVAQLLEP
jgi:hypothetical protein